MRTRLYGKADVVEGDPYYEGKVVVLTPETLLGFKEEFREPKQQIWRATGGFGCDPDKIGRAVFCKSLVDGEKARFNRQDILGVLKPEALEEAKKFLPDESE